MFCDDFRFFSLCDQVSETRVFIFIKKCFLQSIDIIEVYNFLTAFSIKISIAINMIALRFLIYCSLTKLDVPD